MLCFHRFLNPFSSFSPLYDNIFCVFAYYKKLVMSQGLTAASSPTPHFGPVESLLPSSPTHVSFHLDRLQRGSSSTGDVTAAGLTTWESKAKRKSNSSASRSGERSLGMGMKGTLGRTQIPKRTTKKVDKSRPRVPASADIQIVEPGNTVHPKGF